MRVMAHRGEIILQNNSHLGLLSHPGDFTPISACHKTDIGAERTFFLDFQRTPPCDYTDGCDTEEITWPFYGAV